MKLSQINVNNNQNQIIIGPGQFKKSIIGTLSDNLVNDKGPDGKYIISNSSTATASAADYTYRISSVTEGTTCQFWSFMTPPFSERDNILRFLNSNNELVSFSVNTMTLLDNGNINNHEYATYQLIVPDSAVKVEFNIYVAHDSYAFWKQLYTTDDETYLVKWLAISPNGLPEIPKEKLPNTIYDISANDILEGSYGLNTETIIPTFTNGYYLTTNNNYTITKNTYLAESILNFPNSVKEGEQYILHLVEPGIPESNLKNYFIFAQDFEATVSAIKATDISKYAKMLTLGDTWSDWEITIPRGCNYFFSAATISEQSEVSVLKVTRKSLLWLDLDLNHFSLQTKRTITNSVIAPYFCDVINKPIVFDNKILVAFGDSITVGYTSGTTTTQNSYIKLFCTAANSTLNNKAVSGSTFIHRNNNDIVDKVLSFTGSADIIWIAGGTNDFDLSLTVGHWGDNTNQTVYGSLKIICDYLKANYSSAKVIWLTPIPYSNENNRTSGKNANLDYYTQAIFETAIYYGDSVICGKTLGMPNYSSNWSSLMTADGQHPTELGHRLIAYSLCGKLL